MTNKQNISDSLFLLLNSTMLSYVWISSQKPCMCEKQWNGPRVCKCLTWRVFTKFTNAPFPGLTRRTNGRQSVCVWGEGCTSIAGIDWCTMWNHANYGVYPLLESITSLASMMWSKTTPSLKWRKMKMKQGPKWLPVSPPILPFIYKYTQNKLRGEFSHLSKSLGESLRRSEDVKKLDH